MACCGKMEKQKRIVRPKSVMGSVGYTEGQAGYIEIAYINTGEVRVRGKYSGHLYRFQAGVMRLIDANDAQALLERDDFIMAVKEDAASDSSNDEPTYCASELI